jgi:hypothetical protein
MTTNPNATVQGERYDDCQHSAKGISRPIQTRRILPT